MSDMTTQTLILDTTYVLPLFGIAIEISATFSEELQQIWESGIPNYQFYLPSVCLIETMYKLNREFRQSSNQGVLRRFSLIVPTILTSKVMKIIHPFLHPRTSQIAMKIRKAGHEDLMDCMIGASAASMNGILITEDLDLKKRMKKVTETKETVIWSWKDLQGNLSKRE